jgi:hypothetical protein
MGRFNTPDKFKNEQFLLLCKLTLLILLLIELKILDRVCSSEKFVLPAFVKAAKLT